MWLRDDIIQIEKKGIQLQTIENQLAYFRNGFPFIKLLRPAIQGDGIITFSEEEKKDLIRLYEEQSPALRVIKFVPASGAASRMFKHLFEFREMLQAGGGISESPGGDAGFNSVHYFFQHLPRFAFYNDLNDSLHSAGTSLKRALEDRYYGVILDHLLGSAGLNYAALPKALLAFHNYEEGPRSAMEEHLVEAASYTRNRHNVCTVHFTVSPEHIEKFDEKVAAVRMNYETGFDTKMDILYSTQKSSTDTLAVDEENQPFRNSDGSLLFRPAGHGALLANLNELDADLIFIKNIDNIVPDRLKPVTFEYKKLIGSYLMKVRTKIFSFLRKSGSGQITRDEIREMKDFVASQKLIPLPAGFEQVAEEKQGEILARELNRPIRVCGMVRNAGEPGGGPFWVEGQDGRASLQIVESSQVNTMDEEQMEIFRASTHFNPVDLVCCTIDYKGIPFNLPDFVDESTGFISRKSSNGRMLKAQELPGLWNGSMAGWITLFAETPLITFNPVKTINDLLRDEHQ